MHRPRDRNRRHVRFASGNDSSDDESDASGSSSFESLSSFSSVAISVGSDSQHASRSQHSDCDYRKDKSYTTSGYRNANETSDAMARNIFVGAGMMHGGKAALSFVGRLASGGGTGVEDIVDEDDIIAGAVTLANSMNPAQ